MSWLGKRPLASPHHPVTVLSRASIGGGVLILLAMWSVVIIAVFQARDLALQRARSNGANLTTAFCEEVDRTLNSIESVMQIITARIRTDGGADIQRWSRDIPL